MNLQDALWLQEINYLAEDISAVVSNQRIFDLAISPYLPSADDLDSRNHHDDLDSR